MKPVMTPGCRLSARPCNEASAMSNTKFQCCASQYQGWNMAARGACQELSVEASVAKCFQARYLEGAGIKASIDQIASSRLQALDQGQSKLAANGINGCICPLPTCRQHNSCHLQARGNLLPGGPDLEAAPSCHLQAPHKPDEACGLQRL